MELAAQAAGVIPARIAKSLLFWVEDRAVLIIAAGDAKVDNPKFKAAFHTKAKMLTPEEVTDKKRRYAPRGGVAYRLFLWGDTTSKGATPPFGTTTLRSKV